MSIPNDDLQRDLERRALRNVRTLVDKMEDGDAADAAAQKRMLAILVAILAALGLAIAGTLYFRDDKPRPVTIDASKLPPLKAGPAGAPR